MITWQPLAPASRYDRHTSADHAFLLADASTGECLQLLPKVNDGERVEFTGSAAPAPTQSSSSANSLSIGIKSGSDDAEQDSRRGSVYNGYDEVYLGNSGGWYTGFRFEGVNIPEGVTVTNAYIQFTAYSTGSGTTTLSIYGEDDDDPYTFGYSRYDISRRPRTSQSVYWNVSPWYTVGEAGPAQQTPNLKNIVQEIVNRSDWDSGDDLAFILEGSGWRDATSYEGNPSDAAVLHLEWQ